MGWFLHHTSGNREWRRNSEENKKQTYNGELKRHALMVVKQTELRIKSHTQGLSPGRHARNLLHTAPQNVWISNALIIVQIKPDHSNLYWNAHMYVISPLQSSNCSKTTFISHHNCCITLQHTFRIWESSPSNKKATCLRVVFNHLKQKGFSKRKLGYC